MSANNIKFVGVNTNGSYGFKRGGKNIVVFGRFDVSPSLRKALVIVLQTASAGTVSRNILRRSDGWEIANDARTAGDLQTSRMGLIAKSFDGNNTPGTWDAFVVFRANPRTDDGPVSVAK